MKRLAFFVEGLTEQLFVEKLLTEILGEKNIEIEKRKMKGGAKKAITIVEITTPNISDDTSYYLLITDCGGETTVASYIKDQRDSLQKKGYKAIFGILDVRPNWERSDIEKLKQFLYFKIPQKDIETKFILSVMEIEAWFLAEENHYEEMHPALTRNFILQHNNFDPTGNTELLENPATMLNDIYQKVGLSYGKNREEISRTVEKLDYANLYFEIPKRIESLNELIGSIEKYI